LNETIEAKNKSGYNEKNDSISDDFSEIRLFRVIKVDQINCAKFTVFTITHFMSQELVPKLTG
jgi:hypothetical protein